MATPFYFFGDSNVFVLGNHTQTGGSAEGLVFVGGTAKYVNYNVGTSLPIVFPPNNLPRSYSLFVIGAMDITGGTNTQNSALNPVGTLNPPGTLIKYTMTSLGGLTGQPLGAARWDYPLANLIGWLQCSSYGWAYLTSNGTVAVSGTTLTLTGTDSAKNVFEIDATNIQSSGIALSSITNLNINVPAGSTVLINVLGNNVALNNITTTINGAPPTATEAQYILWNMPATSTLAFNSNFYGSILAPNANVTATTAGSQYGTMFANNITGTLLSKTAIFAGTLPSIANPSFSSSCSFTTTTTTTTTSTTTTTTTTTCQPSTYRQAINDLIESVALEQTAISHILNAEGEKIQKAVAMDATADEMIQINTSVQRMVDAISRLELILQSKLETVKCDNCC